MSTDYQILMQKFYKFKEFIKEHSTNTSIMEHYQKMSDNEFLLFGLGFLLPNKHKLELIVTQMCEKVGIVDTEHREKLKRYLECFVEYLEQLNSNELLQDVIVKVATENGVTIPRKDT